MRDKESRIGERGRGENYQREKGLKETESREVVSEEINNLIESGRRKQGKKTMMMNCSDNGSSI